MHDLSLVHVPLALGGARPSDAFRTPVLTIKLRPGGSS